MKRREFLAHSLASGATLALSARSLAQAKDPADQVIVVGAGIAGIAAARELQEAGHAVTIIEGRNRIGGRIHTSKAWKGVPVDLGASWIHGTNGNPLVALASKAGVKTVATDSEEWPVHASDGKLLENFDDLERDVSRDIEKALAAARALPQDQSVLAAIEKRIPLAKMPEAARQQIRFLLNSQIEQEYADDASKLSAKLLWEGEDFGGKDVIFPGGYSAIVDHLSKGLNILAGETVRTIEWNADEVKVMTDKGEHIASRVIITLPIGVLQKGTVKFNPPLPKEKQEAIHQIGAGVLNKICLKFSKVFWQEDADWIGSVSTQPGEFCDWLSLYRTTKQPVLFGFNSGSFGRKIEAWPDRQIVVEAMKVLRRMYGAKAPDPIDMQVTRWATDPFSLCSYSCPRLGMTEHSREQLAKPLGGRLFFAGEATHSDYPATVHGALLSGQRAALEAIKA